jgi:hypothetical protein
MRATVVTGVRSRTGVWGYTRAQPAGGQRRVCGSPRRTEVIREYESRIRVAMPPTVAGVWTEVVSDEAVNRGVASRRAGRASVLGQTCRDSGASRDPASVEARTAAMISAAV